MESNTVRLRCTIVLLLLIMLLITNQTMMSLLSQMFSMMSLSIYVINNILWLLYVAHSKYRRGDFEKKTCRSRAPFSETSETSDPSPWCSKLHGEIYIYIWYSMATYYRATYIITCIYIYELYIYIYTNIASIIKYDVGDATTWRGMPWIPKNNQQQWGYEQQQ